MQWVPFTLTLQPSAPPDVRGMLYDEVSHLRLEYQLEQNGAEHRAEVKHLRIPMAEVLSVFVMKGWQKSSWVGVKIVLQLAKPERCKGFPGLHQGRLELNVSKANAPLAEAFVHGLYGNDLATPA